MLKHSTSASAEASVATMAPEKGERDAKICKNNLVEHQELLDLPHDLSPSSKTVAPFLARDGLVAGPFHGTPRVEGRKGYGHPTSCNAQPDDEQTAISDRNDERLWADAISPTNHRQTPSLLRTKGRRDLNV